jgi:hypothetical protein
MRGIIRFLPILLVICVYRAGAETWLSPNADLNLLDVHTAHKIGKVRSSSMTVVEDSITAAFVGERGAAIVNAGLVLTAISCKPLRFQERR